MEKYDKEEALEDIIQLRFEAGIHENQMFEKGVKEVLEKLVGSILTKIPYLSRFGLTLKKAGE